MAAFDYAKCVVHLRADNAGSATIVDEINGPTAWTFAGAASQSATAPIAGAGSFNITDNDDTKFIRSTNAAVRAAFAFDATEDWCVRFKYRAFNWTNYYGAVLGSGPGNPVFTFRDNGNEFAIPDHSFTIPGGAQTPGTDHEVEISKVSGRVYGLHDGTLMNPGGDAQADAYPTQTEWFICHQPHAPEFFDGWIDELQVFKGVGGHTASYTPAINTPFPGAAPSGPVASLAVTDTPDRLTASGTAKVAVTLARRDAVDTVAASAAARVAASLSVADRPDRLVASVSLVAAAGAAVSEVADRLVAASLLSVVGALASTDAPDLVAASASVGAAPSGVTLLTIDSADVVAALSSTAVAVVMARADADDVLAAIGATSIAAAAYVADVSDVLGSSATLAAGALAATLNAADAADRLTAAASARATAALAAPDASDLVASTALARVLAALWALDAADVVQAAASEFVPFAFEFSDRVVELPAEDRFVDLAREDRFVDLAHEDRFVDL